MNKDMYDKGLSIRRKVLGDAYVDTQLKNADDFNRPLQELVTEYCWGAVWGREGLPLKQRSMLNLAMISILNRPHELKAHIKGALTNGVTKNEIMEVFLQVAIYAGVPCAVELVPDRPRGLCGGGEVSVVMAGLASAIHRSKNFLMDARVKPAHDGGYDV